MAQCWGQTLSPSRALHLTTSVYLGSDLPGAPNLLLTVSPPVLGGLQDGSSVPRALPSACYKASKWKFLGRLCVDDFLPLFKRGYCTVSFGPHALHSKKGLGFFCSREGFVSFVFILAFPLFVFSCRPDI